MLIKVLWGSRVFGNLNCFSYSQKAHAKLTWKLLLGQNPECRDCCCSEKKQNIGAHVLKSGLHT